MRELTREDIDIIETLLDQGHDVEIRLRPKTGDILILEVDKKIKNGK